MKLRSLALNQFRKFTTTTRLNGIGDGLNIIGGPNEMGKSTLLAALRSVLFEKHNSKARPIRELQNARNLAAPVVMLEFELEEGIYLITKRFVKNPYARLRCPDGRELQGDEAEETLRDLLNFNEPNNAGAKPESLGMWSVLWVRQGNSFGSIDMPESARSSLHGALDSQVGAVLGGKRGRALPQAIQSRLDVLVTPNTERPRGQFKALGERVASLDEALQKLRERRRGLTEALDNLENIQKELKRLAAGANDRRDREELEDARKRQVDLNNLEERINTAKTELKLCETRLENSMRAVADRENSRQSITEQEQDLTELDERLSQSDLEEKAALELRDAAKFEARKWEKLLEDSNADESRHKRVLAAARRRDRLRDLENRHNKALAAENRLREFERAAAEISITAESLESIRKADAAVKDSNSKLSAAATRIGFALRPEANRGITVNGEPLVAGTTQVEAIEETSVHIPNVGAIVIEPAIKDRDKLLVSQRESLTALEQLLLHARAANAAEAESQFERRNQLREDANSARRELELYAPATDDHEAGASALGAFIEGLRGIAQTELEALKLNEPPALEAAETGLREIETQTAKTRARWRAKQEAVGGPEKELNRIRQELAKIKGNREEIAARLAADNSRLEAEEEEISDAELRENVNTAQLALTEQESGVKVLQKQRGDESLPQLEARISRLDSAIERRRERRGDLENRQAGLESLIVAADGAGLDEQIELRERDLELAQGELRRNEREVKVLSLLLETLRQTESEAKEKYLAPVLAKVRPYLETLFPGGEILIDEDLGITGLTRGNGYEEQFQHLSMGTQEQIAVLVRLAFAKMLAERGSPATVVLDDALVFSDDRRMERMFDILNMAADDVQVLILTCREQLFERLGGKSLSLESSSGEELVSA